ncbi:hypothetical protein ACS0TY_007267 [Phlomoides rotata]
MLRTPPTELNYAHHLNLYFADPHSPSAEFGGRLHLNGFSTSRASLSPGEATLQKNEQYNEEYNEHLSEAYIEVPR